MGLLGNTLWGGVQGTAKLAGNVLAATAPPAFGLAAGTAYHAAGAVSRAGYLGYSGLKFLAGNKPLHFNAHPEGLLGHLPTFSPRIQALAAGGAVGAAALGGLDRARKNAWTLNQQGGQPELERPDMLGATGSMAINSANGGMNPRMGLYLLDDLALMALRR